MWRDAMRCDVDTAFIIRSVHLIIEERGVNTHAHTESEMWIAHNINGECEKVCRKNITLHYIHGGEEVRVFVCEVFFLFLLREKKRSGEEILRLQKGVQCSWWEDAVVVVVGGGSGGDLGGSGSGFGLRVAFQMRPVAIVRYAIGIYPKIFIIV
jgi:hypothetical protein